MRDHSEQKQLYMLSFRTETCCHGVLLNEELLIYFLHSVFLGREFLTWCLSEQKHFDTVSNQKSLMHNLEWRFFCCTQKRLCTRSYSKDFKCVCVKASACVFAFSRHVVFNVCVCACVFAFSVNVVFTVCVCVWCVYLVLACMWYMCVCVCV